MRNMTLNERGIDLASLFSLCVHVRACVRVRACVCSCFACAQRYCVKALNTRSEETLLLGLAIYLKARTQTISTYFASALQRRWACRIVTGTSAVVGYRDRGSQPRRTLDAWYAYDENAATYLPVITMMQRARARNTSA
jgi:hypothetical protein